MGSSRWVYYVPYQENIEQALQDLRQQVFESGEYYQSWRLHVQEENGGRIDAYGQEIFSNPSSPQNIEEVIKKSEPEGTHSILDIGHVTDVPHNYLAHTQFLTASKPTREIVEMFLADESLWPPVLRLIEANLKFQREKLYGNSKFHPHPFSRKVLFYFENQRTTEELIEAFLTQEDLWEPIHQHTCYMIEKRAWFLSAGKAIPFARETLSLYFGTEKPTKEQAKVVFEQEEIWNSMNCWTGYYTTLYQENAPSEIIFAGYSGD